MRAKFYAGWATAIVLVAVASSVLVTMTAIAHISYTKDTLIDRLKYKPKGRHRAART